MTIKVVSVVFTYSKVDRPLKIDEDKYVNRINFTEDLYRKLLDDKTLYSTIENIMDGFKVVILKTERFVKEMNIYEERDIRPIQENHI